ncbi:MvhA1: methyl-viologen-reducing hydrogenase, alpha subunit [Desulfosarcina variabilis str. Montpellier]|uniref:Ni/Fe hydrogenase subunit alpha n=1 Tax=Desulfosarcina variabilis TaxID=2300 RepID=UPI003AFAB3BF
MTRRILIDPVTRLEGHGRIDIRLDEAGNVSHAFFQVPDFKGFEQFSVGRAAEEMPTLTQKICGVCPTAHHIAGTKALDDLFTVTPPTAARLIRELMHTAFIFEDHLLHFFYLGGPDILVDGDPAKQNHNVFGAIAAMGDTLGRQVINIRKKVRAMNAMLGGSALYPVCGLAGGVSKPVDAKMRAEIIQTSTDALALARQLLAVFHDKVRKKPLYKEMIGNPAFNLSTYYMGLVDDNDRVNFYDGRLRVVTPDGRPWACFSADQYLDHLAERTDVYSYMKLVYLKKVGWNGYQDGPDSGLYRVGPLARLNAAKAMATPLAQQEYERFYDTIGHKPAHNTMLYHWARLIEVLYAAEQMVILSRRKALTDPHVRTLPTQVPTLGVGVCEAPRGTLIHHYQTNANAIVERCNLLVATQNNAAAICLSVEKAARALIKKGNVTDTCLQQVEMAYRAYDPCLACATH